MTSFRQISRLFRLRLTKSEPLNWKKITEAKSTMKSITFTSFLICLFCLAINAQTFNNYQKEYVLKSMTDGHIEAKRTHRMILCDYQPSGLYVRKGEKITLNVNNLNQDYNLASMIGFKPMWGNRNKTQENKLRNGINTVTALQDGILSFIFVKRVGYDTNPTTANVNVIGGKAFPLYRTCLQLKS